MSILFEILVRIASYGPQIDHSQQSQPYNKDSYWCNEMPWRKRFFSRNSLNKSSIDIDQLDAITASASRDHEGNYIRLL